MEKVWWQESVIDHITIVWFTPSVLRKDLTNFPWASIKMDKCNVWKEENHALIVSHYLGNDYWMKNYRMNCN